MSDFEKARDEARKTNHALWCGFLNDNPDNASCPQSPSEVYSEAFEAGADWAHEWTLQLRDDMRDDLRAEIERLKAELAKREGELHMNSDFNVEKLHMNSKGEPAKCELHKNDDVTQNSDINIVSRANPAAIPNGDNGGAKMPPLRRMQFNGHEYVHLQEVLESVDAIKAERDRLLDREKGEG